ncbi:alpha/beta hydrolase [Archangium gephyra]|uniref:alpha/beta hydrolase n=1 Tax=Archangium gephyra TaxID=48 RepID=UPI0035D450C5
MSKELRSTEPVISSYQQSDGYRSHFRRWGRPEGGDVVVLLHGGISHSGWQAPLGEALTSTSDITFIAMDRRGSGLNTEARGHLLSEERELEDVTSFLRDVAGSFHRVHLAGWCFGGLVASIAAARLAAQGILSSLILVAPGFVFNERYSDVLRLSMQAVFEVVEEFGLMPDPQRAFVPVPLQPTDFTDRHQWQQFVVEDKLRLSKVTQNTLKVWYELADRSRTILADLGGLPVLAVFGNRDRLVDNERVKAMLMQHVRPAPAIESLEAHHAIQFEEPLALANLVTRFVSRLEQHHTAAPGNRPSAATSTAPLSEA